MCRPRSTEDSKMDPSDGCHLNCSMQKEEIGKFNLVAILRLITALFSVVGAFSIVGSAVYRKTVCNPKVHPIFVLSIVDALLSVLWISGALVWLKGGLRHREDHRVDCFTINCVTVILQCVAMNVTLIYALLAYSSIKQRDFSGIYMVQQRPVSVHVWPPLCSFTAYFIAWTLPVVLIMVPFGVIAQEYQVVHKANNCSCSCLPFYGNVLPRPNMKGHNQYLVHLHYFVTSYAAVLTANFTVVLCCMAVVYYKVFRRIRRMMLTQENNENAPLFGATQAMILAGQKDARRRVLLFFFIYIITGIMTFILGIFSIISINVNQFHSKKTINIAHILLFLEALLVPSQGFMNALAYGWTRGDFLSVMSTRRVSRSQPDSLATSHDAVENDEGEEEEETEVEDENWEGGGGFRAENSLIFSSSGARGSGVAERRQRGSTALTPVSPGCLLGDV